LDRSFPIKERWREPRDRSRMNCMKITLHLLALCLLLSITTKVSGKPNPRHLLIETEEQAKKTADYKEPGTDYNKAENDDDYQLITMTSPKRNGGYFTIGTNDLKANTIQEPLPGGGTRMVIEHSDLYARLNGLPKVREYIV